MKKVIFFIIFYSLSMQMHAQQFQFNSKDLKGTIKILTSDSLKGRETGTIGQQKTAKFISDKFKSFGLSPFVNKSFLEPYNIICSYWSNVYIKYKNKQFNNFQDIIYIGAKIENNELKKKIVFGGNGSIDQLCKIDVKGKIVVVFTNNLRTYNIINNDVKRKGAYGLILTNPSNSNQFRSIAKTSKQNFLKKYYFLLSNSHNKKLLPFIDSLKPIKTWYLTNSSVKNIFGTSINNLLVAMHNNRIESIPNSTVTIRCEKVLDTLYSSNVCGFIKGKTNKSIIITAHYDHLGSIGRRFFPGADDNASGTAALIALAKEFANDRNLNYNLVFLATSGEEEGLLGSEFFANTTLPNTENILCNINMDMISRNDSLHSYKENYLYSIGTDRSEYLKSILIKAENTFKECKFDFSLDNTFDSLGIYTRADQYSFSSKGIPSILFFSGLHNDYHKVSDTKEKINFSVYEKRVQLIATVIKLLENELLE